MASSLHSGGSALASARKDSESELSIQNDYELEDIAVTPRYQENPDGNFRHIHREVQDASEDEDSDGEDAGGRALLGPGTRTSGHKRVPSLTDRPSTWVQIRRLVIETAPTLLLTTTGLLFTGELLDQVSRWRAMTLVNELIMIIPVILNLKGNLEMNLSARLGTSANVGELDVPATRRAIVLGNLSLLQVQAAVVSFVAANVSFLLSHFMPPLEPQKDAFGGNGTVVNGTDSTVFFLYARAPARPHRPIADGRPKSGLAEYIMVASSAMCATCLSSIVLGSFMCSLVILCRKVGLDPDNIAPPVAACLGDLVTLLLLGAVSSVLINFIATPYPLILAVLFACAAAVCGVLTHQNTRVRPLLTQGWAPLFGAMVISSGTGIVLDLFVSRYSGFALLAVVISGLPGSAGSVFVSRLSTALHAAATSALPVQRVEKRGARATPSTRLVMLTLLFVTFPIEVIFLALLRALGWMRLPFVFVAFSVFFFCCAVATSLLLARALTAFLWARGLDPDVYALPIHSALMDLVGQLLLVGCFELVSKLGANVELHAPT